MSLTAPVAILRRPLAYRLYVGTIASLACLVLTVGLVEAVIARSPAALVMLVVLTWVVAVSYSDCRVSLEVHSTGLTVRNRFRTYEIARDDVHDFRIGPTGWDPMRESIHVWTRDGQSIELAVTRRLDSVHGRRLRLERLLDELKTWQAGPPEPGPALDEARPEGRRSD